MLNTPATPIRRNPILELERERRHRIAEAAYFLAEKRGFQSDEISRVRDWLKAEREIDEIMAEGMA